MILREISCTPTMTKSLTTVSVPLLLDPAVRQETLVADTLPSSLAWSLPGSQKRIDQVSLSCSSSFFVRNFRFEISSDLLQEGGRQIGCLTEVACILLVCQLLASNPVGCFPELVGGLFGGHKVSVLAIKLKAGQSIEPTEPLWRVGIDRHRVINLV